MRRFQAMLNVGAAMTSFTATLQSTPARWWTWPIRVGALCLGLLIISGLFTAHWLASYAQSASLAPQQQSFQRATPAGDHVSDRSFSGAESGIEIRAFVFEPAHPPRGTLLILHGLGSTRHHMTGVGERYRDAGFLAIVPDLRGHGDSTGEHLGFGISEAEDLSALLDQLEASDELAHPIHIYGPSYGGAVALQTASRDTRIASVVSVSTFRSLWGFAESRLRRALGADRQLPRWAVHIFARLAATHAGIDMSEIEHQPRLANSNARFLLVHGSDDQLISVEQTLRVSSTCRPHQCQVEILTGVRHHESLQSPRVRSLSLRFFLSQTLDAPAPS